MPDPQREQQFPPRWLVIAEYEGETIITGPYLWPDAQRLRDYAMRSDAPMGQCSVELEVLDPPVDVADLEREKVWS